MYNFTSKKFCFFKFLLFVLLSFSASAQVCGTPGVDGPITISSAVNSYYPVLSSTLTLNAGAQSIQLAGVPATDIHGNNFGALSIATGDLILIIQMQDAEINYTNSDKYGSGSSTFFTDNQGGTGFTNIGNTGLFEYVIATNNVPLSGGNLTFKGTGTGGGVKNTFYNAVPTATRGKRTFQIIRVPQYSNLTLNSNITTPPYNGTSGGVIAFNVSGTFNFANYTIEGNARGFRGGWSPVLASNTNNSTTYVGLTNNTAISGKGEGIAGTPRYMWDGFNEVGDASQDMPGGSAGRGAPGNAGGGGNDHNAGGGGGGNGGYGGLGGLGWQGGNGDTSPKTGGGRPGYTSYRTANPPLDRLIMGGGGGGGDANNATTGVKGGVGGAIILINAGSLAGIGRIEANGSNGAAGAYGSAPDGAGGGGAGGSVFLNISNASTATITIEAKGGNGGNTEYDGNNEHGPGGGGGGGIVRYNASGAAITSNLNAGLAGKTNNGVTPTSTHGATNGVAGYSATFAAGDLAQNLQINSDCFPTLETKVISLSPSVCNAVNNEVSYEIQIKNIGGGNAAKVYLDFTFPTGIDFLSATAVYSTGASGPTGFLFNNNTANKPLIGDFNIAKDGIVTITLKGKITSAATVGVNNVNAQAIYLDPTRTTANPNRQITAFTDSFGNYFKKYEGGSTGDVPGANFNGSSSTIDNVEILALPAAPTITTTQPDCSTSTGTIKVTSPVNGTGISYTLTGIAPVVAPVSNFTGQFSGLVAGTYQLTTTNANSCSSLPSSPITISPISGAPITTSISICVGGSGKLIASGCSNDDAIQWFTEVTGGILIYTGATFNPIGVSGSGLTNTNTAARKTYYASCDGSVCRSATNFVINPIPTINTVTPGTICGTGSATLSATASSGTISWYDLATGGTEIGTGATYATPSLSVSKTYYVQVTDNGCTSARTSVTATVTAIPIIKSTAGAERCGPGTLTLKAIGSAGEVNWYANAQGGTSLFKGTDFIIPSLSVTTTYYVDATDNGCTSGSRLAVAATVNAVSTLMLTTGMQNQTICSGTAIAATVYTFGGSATGINVTNLPSGLSSNVNSLNNTVTISGTPTAAGTYTITTIGHSGSCSAASLSGKIAFTAINTVSVASSSPTLCINSALTAITHTTTGATGIGTVTGLPAGVTATWSSDKISITGTPTASGTFNYSIPLSGGCGSINAIGKIIVNNSKTTPIVSTTAATCSAPGTMTLTNYASGNSYVFSPTGPVVSTSGVITGGTIGTSYNVKATNGSGCISAASTSFTSISLTQLATAVAPTVGTSTQPTCSVATGSVVLSGLPSSGTWTLTRTPGKVTTTGTGTSTTISGLSAGTYTYTVTNAAGCTSVPSMNVVINAQPPLPEALTAIAATNITCDGFTANWNAVPGATAYGISVSTSDSYNSHVANYDTKILDGRNDGNTSTSYSVAGVVPGETYYYKVWLYHPCYPAGGVSGNTITVVLNPNLTVGTASSTANLCINTVLSPITHATTNTTGIVSALDLPSGVTASFSSNTVTISGTPTVLGTFNYNIELSGGCGTKNAVGTIIVNPSPTAIITGNLFGCLTTTLTATTNSSTATYVWYRNNIEIVGETASILVVTDDGNYKVKVLDGLTGCEMISAVSVVAVTPQPVQPTIACYQSATFNTTTCVWDVTGSQPAQPTIACYQTATFNTTTCVWDVTGSQPAQPTIACYQTATFNTTTCVWDVTGTQPVQPTLACYESATFNTTTCVWDVTGSQPVQPAIACYQTATFNTTTCVWDVTGSQPVQPAIACYQTATFNTTTCVWDVTGSQPVQPTIACYETATFNTTTCLWDVTGTQPAQPTIACYETATFNTTTCLWDVTGTQPVQPTLACYESATFNTTTCLWDVTGSQPVQPAIACYQTATFNTTTCLWDVTGTQPAQPTIACYQAATFNTTTCLWDVTGSQPVQPAIACYQTATFNTTTCVWDVTGSQPVQPAIACYETATFNTTTCVWDVTGSQPVQPAIACYETATFNTTTCLWDVTGTQPAQPTIACYQAATFNTTTCLWDVTGSQPVQPAIACYQTATFNTTTCVWDVTGSQPVQPAIACYETATFNTTTCVWDVTGSQPAQPTIACYESATFNTTTCLWDVTGTQPAQPTIACYESATFNTTTCVWDVTGSQPVQPTIACYQTATFNTTTCLWDVTGSQPVQPTIACYQTATFNTTTCVWDVTGSQPAQPTIACYQAATFNTTTCLWDVTGSQPAQPTIACYQAATFNTTTCVWDVTGSQPVQPTLACYQTATFNTTTCVWDVTGSQPVQPTLACYESATFNTTTCVWDVTGSQPAQPTIACYESATFNTTTCVWDVTGSQPVQPTMAILTQPTCALPTGGSIFLSGLPLGNWTINPGSILGAGATYTLAGLTAGTFSYTVTDANGCISIPSANATISNVICANADTPTAINGKDGGTTASVLDNDTLNGQAVVASEVDLTPIGVYPTGITLNTNGTIVVAAGTPEGTHTVEYTICEKLNPTNCSTATVTVIVQAAVIKANDDGLINVDGINGAVAFLNVLNNDNLNRATINPSQITLVSNNIPNGIVLNADGTLDVAPNTAGGTYIFDYQICEIGNGANCATATVSIFVEAPAITLVRTVTFNDENGNGVVDQGETITYSFTVTNTGNTTLQNIQITDSLKGLIIIGGPITLGVNQIDTNSFSANYTITQNDIDQGTISSQATVIGFTNSGIKVEDSSDYNDAIKDYPTVLPSQNCVIKIFNALSLNGDSTNERFYIQGIECYPDNTVEIYNRWGVLVYEKSNYDNVNSVFKGFSEGRVTIKESGGLPTGTYFYVLKYKDSSSKANQQAGYLYITK